MGWRSVMITQSSYLSLCNNALQIRLKDTQAHVPLEDLSILLIDHPQVTVTSQLLTAFAESQIAVVTVGSDHHPNGVFLPFTPHSRVLKVMRAQLALSTPTKKRLHRLLIQQKIINQASCLSLAHHLDEAKILVNLATRVRSGDPDNLEAQAAQLYFRKLFKDGIVRDQKRFYNSSLNFGYAILRASIARSLVSFGFLPAFGLFHHSEQNAFNLADDLIEPFRPLLDRWICVNYTAEPENDLSKNDKAILLSLLHEDTRLTSHSGIESSCTILAGIEATVMSLVRIVQGSAASTLVMPVLDCNISKIKTDDADRAPEEIE